MENAAKTIPNHTNQHHTRNIEELSATMEPYPVNVKPKIKVTNPNNPKPTTAKHPFIDSITSISEAETHAVDVNQGESDTVGNVNSHNNNFIDHFCSLLSEDYLDTAWKICKIRFIYNGASRVIASDLRDTWLSIIEMQLMDNDLEVLEPVEFPSFKDGLPLPPKFDTWSHGALELLPRGCRESVMDPFLREPFPWFMEKYMEDHKHSNRFSSATSSTLQSNYSEFYDTEIVRPSSPISAVKSNSTESLWSLASTRGTTPQVGKRNSSVNTHSLSSLLGVSNNASVASIARFETPKALSFEFLYSSNNPQKAIKGSSEIAYNSGGFRRTGDDDHNKESAIVAFKLPNETSSESRRMHFDRLRKQIPDKLSSLSHKHL